ncbi:protein-glutamate methylesterase/protein-glutamine glutaminase [Chungangia koreensis]|uniref:protein-glutamate methylesterase/protein-glutamine glutaminase n=1 Tax=Chungangia koreensis TaxID=752657 RepID=UPI003671F63E
MEAFQKKKLLIVDDSAFMRKLIADFFEGHPTIQVVGIARNGKDALTKISHLQPDVITLDIEMPEMDGLQALKAIMEEHPIPVVMLSSMTKAGADATLKAMEYGAFDFVAKPSGTISLDLHRVRDDLIEKVVAGSEAKVSKLKKVEKAVRESGLQKPKPALPSRPNPFLHGRKKLVVIGTSTGGPRALQTVLSGISADIDAPILIVQHMPPGFTKSLAERLNQICSIHVKEAEHGELVKRGTAYIAPGGFHMKIKVVGSALSLYLDGDEPPRGGHRPAVDVLFESVSFIGKDLIAVIMTGMGADGTKGLRQMKSRNNVVAIAESQQTCIVYGMPKSAVESNLVDDVVDLENIAKTIMKYLP